MGKMLKVVRGWNPDTRKDTRYWEIREVDSNRLLKKTTSYSNANKWLKQKYGKK